MSVTAEKSNVDLAMELRDEPWFDGILPVYVDVGGITYREWLLLTIGRNLDRIAWAASVWLMNQGWYLGGHDKPTWAFGGSIATTRFVSDPDPIRATLLAAIAAKETLNANG